MYSVLDYGRMACDGVRMDAYARAIASAVRPGCVVVDLGAGSGILSILAARAGAKRVHAIDPNPAIWLLPELAAENGVADRITVHHASSLDVELPERADVILSDLRGSFPLHGDHVGAVRDARARLLAPGGVQLPARDRMFVAVVENEEIASALARGWKGFERAGVRASAARASILNSVYDDRARPLHASDVLSTSECWATVDYTTYEGEALEASMGLSITRAGIAHGLAVWFEATVSDGITYSTAPGWSLTYARTFLPLFDAVPVVGGDTATVTLRVDARGGRWAWETELSGKRFRQSTFFGAPTSPDALLREASSHKPTLSPRGQRARRVLEAMNGQHTVLGLVDAEVASTPEGPLRTALKEEVRETITRYGS